MRLPAGESMEIVLDRTPFYAESGGQVRLKSLCMHSEIRPILYCLSASACLLACRISDFAAVLTSLP